MPVNCSDCDFFAEDEQHYFHGDDCPRCEDGTLWGAGGSSMY